MASIRKRGDKWQVQIKKNGERRSETFSTKARATAWATAVEHELETVQHGGLPDKTFAQLLERYRDEYVPGRKGEKWEVTRINMFLRDEKLVNVSVKVLDATHVVAWRDRRIKLVQPNSVRREWTIMATACAVAIREWKWLKINPFVEVVKPAKGKARTRRITDDEIKLLTYSAGYDVLRTPDTITARVGAVLLFAIETAMRSGEICALTWEHVYATHVHLPDSKNSHARDVPLSAEATRLIEQMRGVAGCETLVFGMEDEQRDVLFRKIRDRCGIEDLHFHDSRREALSRLSKKLDVMELARMSGHLDLRILMSVYYAPKIEDLAAKL